MIAIQGQRYRRQGTDTLATFRHIPLLSVPNLHDVIPYDCIPVAIEITENAKDIRTFEHPERAFYIFGPEDGSIPNSVLSWCKQVVRIPTKHCMNLAATVNVVLYDRLAKQEITP